MSNFSWWANEAFFSLLDCALRALVHGGQNRARVELQPDQDHQDLALVVLIGVIYRVVAFFCMTGLNREKQS
jgi:hypothetical protein